MEKLISFSGTPTVVWRRTGEICLVAPEFCMLTEWPMEDLIGRKKYIYEVCRLLLLSDKPTGFNCLVWVWYQFSFSKTNLWLSIGKTLLLMLSKILRVQSILTACFWSLQELQYLLLSASQYGGTCLIFLAWLSVRVTVLRFTSGSSYTS